MSISCFPGRRSHRPRPWLGEPGSTLDASADRSPGPDRGLPITHPLLDAGSRFLESLADRVEKVDRHTSDRPGDAEGAHRATLEVVDGRRRRSGRRPRSPRRRSSSRARRRRASSSMMRFERRRSSGAWPPAVGSSRAVRAPRWRAVPTGSPCRARSSAARRGRPTCDDMRSPCALSRIST